MASVWNYGGSHEKRDDLPMNYIATNSQFCLKKFPTTIGRGLLEIMKLWIQKTIYVNFMYKLRAISNNVSPERAITSFRMVDVDIRGVITQMVSKEVSEVNEDGRTQLDAANDSGLSFHNNSDDLYQKNVDAIREILDGMTVPFRKGSQTRGEHNCDNQGEIIANEQILFRVTRSDIERYLCAMKHDLKATVVRIVESCAWRGVMFPVDTRSCRIEMRSGQFFQQGYDKDKNPIFYFRNVLLGPWRSNIHATILSVLHRLETYLVEVEHGRPSVKITVIAFMGNPFENENGQIQVKKTGNHCTVGEHGQLASKLDADPRIDMYEQYHPHSNVLFMGVLNEVIQHHFPERVAKILVVASKDWAKARRRPPIHSPLVQYNVNVLSSVDGLKKYVDKDELVTFAGGNAKVTPDAFDCIGACDLGTFTV